MKIIVDEFIDDLKSKQASANTVASYERDVVKFCDYFELKNKKLLDLVEEDLQEYVEYLEENDKSNSTISRVIASIKCFYKYLYEKKLIKENIAEGMSTPKVDRKEPIILTREEIEKLLSQPDESELKGRRDKTMLAILYATGMRVTELISLNMDSISLVGNYIKVKKKNSERQIPIGGYASKCLNAYINDVRPLLIKTEAEKSLFINSNGKKMTRQGFWKILKQYKEQANIDKDLTPHVIRHSFAVHMLQDGVDLRKVKELLGHTDIASTMLYAQMLEKQNDYTENNLN